MKRLLLFSFLLVSINYLSFSQDFEVAPVELNFNADPGEMQNKTITIKNHANKKNSFIISQSDFLINSRGEKTYHPQSTTKNSVANWLNISPAYFELNPNEERQITISCQAPIDNYKSAWGVLNIQTVEEQSAFDADKDLSTGMFMTGRIIVQIFQSPKINTNKKIKINKLEEVTEVSDTVRLFRANLDNIGDKITKCKVYLVASNLKTAEEIYFEHKEFSTYPKASLQVELPLNKKLPSGKYALAAIVDYGNDVNLEGTQIIIEVQ